MKQCINNKCEAMIEDDSAHCKFCGTKQKVKPVRKGFMNKTFSKKRQEPEKVDVANPQQFEDLKKVLPQMRPNTKENQVLEAINNLRVRIDILNSNHDWLVMNINNWLQGYKNTEEEKNEKNK